LQYYKLKELIKAKRIQFWFSNSLTGDDKKIKMAAVASSHTKHTNHEKNLFNQSASFLNF
jgi:hypothetical protein